MKRKEIAELIRVASGIDKADLVVLNGTLLNVYTGELLEGYSVAAKGERIAHIGKELRHSIGPNTTVVDANGKIIVPGFIDTHAHLCFYCSVEEYLKYSMRGGTTTIVTELMEIAFPLGYRGILEFLESCRKQPVKIFALAPPMVTLSSTTRANALKKSQLKELLRREDILGLGETYWLPVVEQDERLLQFFEETFAANKMVTGHSAGAKGNKLNAYAASGVRSCHEPISAEEVLERLRLGMYVLLREGEIRKDLEAAAKIKDLNVDLHQLALVTDGLALKQLIEEGHMEVVLKKAIDLGFDPVAAIQMVTINAARYLNLDDQIGGIAPGKYADMVIIPDLYDITAEYVISNGRLIARNRELLVPPRTHFFPDWTRRSIRLSPKFSPDDFKISAPAGADYVKVRAIEQVTELVTQEIYLDLPVLGGMIEADPERDLLKVAAIDFLSNPGKKFVGLIKGFKMDKGAIASSMAWDLTNIVAVGANDADLALAVNRVVELQGGAAVCAGGQVLAELSLPIGGYLTDAPIEEIAQKIEELQQATAALGSPFSNTHLTLMTLTTPAIPFFRICEEGLVNIKTNERFGLLV